MGDAATTVATVEDDDSDRSLDPTLLEPPSACVPASLRRVLDDRALERWVPQQGKTCAAAVVAGALNCVQECAVHDGADVLRAYASMWRGRIETVRQDILAAVRERHGGEDGPLAEFVEHVQRVLEEGEAGELVPTSQEQVQEAVDRVAAKWPSVQEPLQYLAKLLSSLHKVRIKWTWMDLRTTQNGSNVT